MCVLTALLCRDSLQRHKTLHNSASKTQEPKRVRSRVRKACNGCSNSRLRCDGCHPCARCSSKSKPCLYTPFAHQPTTSTSELALGTVAEIALFQQPLPSRHPWSVSDDESLTVDSTAGVSEVAGLASGQSSHVQFGESFPWPLELSSMLGWMMPEPVEHQPTLSHNVQRQLGATGLPNFPSLDRLRSPGDMITEHEPRVREAGWSFHWDAEKPLAADLTPAVTETSTDIYEMEDFAHVPPLSQENFSNIEKLLHNRNSMGALSEARLPPLAAMNTFVQLYFEYFHPGFPMLHRGSFNASIAPCALVLAVALLGCRYSRTSLAAEYGNLLQELLRRSLPTIASSASL